MPYCKFAGIVLTLLLMGGCASEEQPEGVIPQGYEDAMDKADGVEGQLQDAAKLRMEPVDEER